MPAGRVIRVKVSVVLLGGFDRGVSKRRLNYMHLGTTLGKPDAVVAPQILESKRFREGVC